VAEETRITTRTERLDPRGLRLLEVNAHYMPNEKFSRLVDNFKRDGGMTGNTPFAVRVFDADGTASDPPVYRVISGNHRVKAAIVAGLVTIDVTLTDDPLTKNRLIAIQLSHNELFGDDDPAILKTLYQEIDDVDMRLYSGLDDKKLNLLTAVSIASLSEAALQFQTIALTFLPHEVEGVTAALESARKAAGSAKAFWLMRWSDYDKAMDALEAAGSAYGIKSAATAMMLVLEIFTRHMNDLQAGYLDDVGEAIDPKRAVPVESVLGRTLPAKLAARLKKAGIRSGADLEALLDATIENTNGAKDDRKRITSEHGEAGADSASPQRGSRKPAGGGESKGHRGGAQREQGDGIG